MQLLRIELNKERVRRLVERLQSTSIDRLVLSQACNIFYLTNLWPVGPAALSIRRSGDMEIFGSSLDLHVVESDEVRIFAERTEADTVGQLARSIASHGDRYVEVDRTGGISSRLESASNSLVKAGNRLVDDMRSVKDDDELRTIRRCGGIAKEGMRAALESLREGATEREVARAAQVEMISGGADGVAFDIGIGSGWRASLPHAPPTDKRIARGELVVVDLGADLAHYKSDVTRSVAVGPVGDIEKKVLDTVVEAYDISVGDVVPGAKISELAKRSDDIITSAGFSEGILHGLGHGVGLEIHEGPAVTGKNTGELVAGHVVTIEPGIYVRGVTGARWEDTVLVTKAGHATLT